MRRKPHELEDETLGRIYDGALVRRLLGYLNPYRRLAYWALALQIALALFDTGVTYLPKIMIDTYIGSGNLSGLLMAVIVYIAALLVIFILEYGQFYLVNLMSQRAMRDLRNELFVHLETRSLSFFNRTPVGRILTRITSDIEALDGLFSNGVVNIIADLLRVVALAGMLMWLDFKLAFVTFAVLPLVALVSMRFKFKVRIAYRQVRRWISTLNGYIQEHITGMSTVQAFTGESKSASEYREYNQNHTNAHIASMRNYAVFYPTVDFLGVAGVAAILWFGARWLHIPEDSNGSEIIGTLFVFVLASQKFFQPIRDLADKFNILQAAMAASERIFALLDTQEKIPEPENPHAPKQFEGRVEFEDVWFAYKEEEWVLKGISFTAKPGQRVAFVGATGAGKSTIINLLLRFYDPQKGRILLDGVDIREMDLSTLRGHIGLVLQDVFLFSGDIASNVRLDKEEIDDEAIRRACKLVCADRFIERMPNGYSEEVKERGATLSVGQRQLLSFARALAYNPSLLVLDEATSSIDTETEALIVEALEHLMEGRTSLVVAHRLSTIQHADQILVLHQGQIAERGTHQELLSKGGIYFRLYQLQYKEQVPTGTEG